MILFKQATTGKMTQWRAWAVGPSLFTEYGQVDGKLQTSEVICKAMNVGKANETTPEEQAIIECKALYELKRKKGYSDTGMIKIANQPMLAHVYEDHKKKLRFPCHAQPKLDGIRCNVNKNILLSREGNPFRCLDYLRTLNLEHVLDGELYLHGVPFETMTRILKGSDPGCLEYHVYDIMMPGTFTERITWLSENTRVHFYVENAL